MSYKKITGIIPAFISAFNADGSLSIEATKKHAQRLVEQGADSLYVGGSSGEMILLSVDERKAQLDAVLEAVPADFPIIAHVGAANPVDAYELAKYADKAGAAAISSVAPFYYKYEFREIKAYYEKLAASSEAPTIMYNIPALSGVNFSMKQLSELLSLPNVEGMKFTCSDYFLFERVRKAFPEKALYNGSDEMVCAGLAMGADGGIGTTYNIMVSKFAKLYKLFKENKVVEALEIQHDINDVIAELFNYPLLPAVKYLVYRCGCDCGTCRDPFSTLTDEEKDRIEKNVAGKLTWDIQ